MTTQLSVTTGQHSDKGLKPLNQDFHGLVLPENHQLRSKGIAVAIADGISSSNVSQIASESAVAGFLSDYYSTPDSWTVKQSAQRVLRASNAWLHAQTRQSRYRYDQDRGYVCTLSVLVLKSATAHLFHVGDARVYRVQGDSLDQLTSDHRVWLSRDDSCLNRAMGLGQQLDIDYLATPVWPGDTFVLATDGVYEHLCEGDMAGIIRESCNDLENAAKQIVAAALGNGSDDNLSVQIVRVDSIPASKSNDEITRNAHQLPFAPELHSGHVVDGYRIQRPIHASSRSHVYLAVDEASSRQIALKVPAMEMQQDPAALEHFTTEQWVAQRINSPHVVRAFAPERQHSCLYLATEYVQGVSLKQWLQDNPHPDLETVRRLVEQIARGLRAFHRLEMVHQDLKPENILIDNEGTVVLIDFGATRIAGLQELKEHDEPYWPRGAALYSAPETFLGEPASWQADQFSLGVITYQLLTGQLPYGTRVPGIRNPNQLRRLSYHSARLHRNDLPGWVDSAIARAVNPEPHKRYQALSEFLFDLRQPSRHWHQQHRKPLIERHPVGFWQGLSALLLFALILSFAYRP
ncbi:bifunctional protein-serine/threonine kinase/phosphatase [Marinobacter sp. 1_MG-2023]|uniref:bifunctional protein-serine/threonine kinase/phosphatase n=1 Tax=Marinobacter sp. 1_MG-2023 TaxID=3062627 RepID=UPI0026E2086D|nr:bifunctional protein-serine/threonine kinase/phosphatase [Marinobacter sp. 1_MG-2023]MDO6824654.1 bifunctional protein-serine/threonine kinase/phosphatase [Marinobacter sp. 1_MG-2023]